VAETKTRYTAVLAYKRRGDAMRLDDRAVEYKTPISKMGTVKSVRSLALQHDA